MIRHIIPNRTDNRAHSERAKASLTVEASMVFTLFFFTVYLFWQCFLLIFFELSVADGVGKASRAMANIGYAERRLAGEDAEDLAVLYLPELLLKVESPDYVTWKVILCTSDDGGAVNILVRYNFLCIAPLFPEFSLPVHQAFKVYPYIGVYDEDKLEQSKEDGQEENDEDDDGNVVYITRTGRVYHESKTCTYLKTSVSAVAAEQVAYERNSSGGKYYECSACKDCTHTGLVYITEYGDRFHYSVKCSKIHRDIIEIRRSEIGDRPACSKCGR